MKRKVFTKTISGKDGGPPKEIKAEAPLLNEAMDPSLSKERLLIPGFNAKYNDEKKAFVSIDGTSELFIYFLTKHYEDRLFDLVKPAWEEFKTWFDVLSKEGVEQLMKRDIAETVGDLFATLTIVLGDVDEVMCRAASVVAEASITLKRKYRAEALTDEDRNHIALLTPQWFAENVPVQYMMKYIVMAQYRRTALADMLSVFFSKALTKASILSGLENLIPKATGLTTAFTSEWLSNAVASPKQSTTTQEPN